MLKKWQQDVVDNGFEPVKARPGRKRPANERLVPTKAAEHISQSLCQALMFSARDKDQLSKALTAVDKANFTPIQGAQPAPKDSQPRPAALAYYAQVAKSGSAERVLQCAALSSCFREHYAQVIKWAKSKVT